MGETWVCIATGPSLTREDVDYARQHAAVAVCSDAWRLATDARLMLASDSRWWRKHGDAVNRSFKGQRYTCSHVAARRYGPRYLAIGKHAGVCLEPDTVANGELTGYRLINLVIHQKPSRILLLGYDHQHTGGRTHYFGDHPDKWPNCPNLPNQVGFFQQLADESPVPIINCSRETALECFPRAELREVLR